MNANRQVLGEGNVQGQVTPAADANVGASDGKVVELPAAPVVPMEAPAKKEAKVNLKQKPLNAQAFSFYLAPAALRSGFAPRCYLPYQGLVRLACALGRQVTYKEITQLIGRESATDTCAVTKRVFQPIWWVDLVTPDSEDFFRNCARRRELNLSYACYLGSYFIQDEDVGDGAFVVSGAPYVWKGYEQELARGISPMVEIYTKNDFRWGSSKKVWDEVVVERQRRRAKRDERFSAINSVAAALHAKKTGGKKN